MMPDSSPEVSSLGCCPCVVTMNHTCSPQFLLKREADAWLEPLQNSVASGVWVSSQEDRDAGKSSRNNVVGFGEILEAYLGQTFL